MSAKYIPPQLRIKLNQEQKSEPNSEQKSEPKSEQKSPDNSVSFNQSTRFNNSIQPKPKNIINQINFDQMKQNIKHMLEQYKDSKNTKFIDNLIKTVQELTHQNYIDKYNNFFYFFSNHVWPTINDKNYVPEFPTIVVNITNSENKKQKITVLSYNLIEDVPEDKLTNMKNPIKGKLDLSDVKLDLSNPNKLDALLKLNKDEKIEAIKHAASRELKEEIGLNLKFIDDNNIIIESDKRSYDVTGIYKIPNIDLRKKININILLNDKNYRNLIKLIITKSKLLSEVSTIFWQNKYLKYKKKYLELKKLF